MNTVNLIAEVCSLVICCLIIVSNKNKINSKSLQYKYFKSISYALLFNIIINLCRYNVSDTTIKYILILLFHSSVSLLYVFSVLYCISLFPLGDKDILKYKKFFYTIYGFFIVIILSSPITHLVYFIEDGEIVRGIFACISFFTGYFGITSIIYFLIIKNNTSKRIIKKIILFSVALVIPSIFEFIYPHIILNGFGFAAGLMIIFESFHCNNYDIFYGTSKDDALFQDFQNFRNKKRGFSLIVLNFLNLDYIESKLSKKVNNAYISDIFRHCEKLKYNPEIFSWNNEFVILLKTNDKENVDNFLKKLQSCIGASELNNIEKLDYKIVYMRAPIVVEKIEYLKELQADEKIHEFSLKDKENLDYRNALIGQFKDIFSLNDLSDPRIEIFYQPILNNSEQKFLSAEALSRLNIKELGGLIFPDNFISILEEKNYIHKFSCIVLNKVCLFIKQLEAQNIEFEGISVNFSLKEFMEDNFEEDIINIVNKNGIDPASMHIEVTESIEAENMELVKSKINNLKNLGFKFYLDDFGTGYSNLSEILSLPFDIIKIDRSLVSKALEDSNTKDILSGISTLLLHKNFSVLFEGIEDLACESLVKELKIPFSQGYKYSKPIRAINAINFIGKHIDEIIF